MINTIRFDLRALLFLIPLLYMSCKSNLQNTSNTPDNKTSSQVMQLTYDNITGEKPNFISFDTIGDLKPILDTYKFAKGVTEIKVKGKSWQLVFADSLGNVENVINLIDEHYYANLPFEKLAESNASKLVYKTSNEEVIEKGYQIHDFAHKSVEDEEIANYDISILEAEAKVHIQQNGYVAVYFLIWTYNTAAELIGISNGWTKIYSPSGELIAELDHGGESDMYITSDGKYLAYIGAEVANSFNIVYSYSVYFYRLSDLKLLDKYTAQKDDDILSLNDMCGDAFVLGIIKYNTKSYIRVYNFYTNTVYEDKFDRSLTKYGIGRDENGIIYRNRKTKRKWSANYKETFNKIKTIKQ
jgi:hypothetical protein